VSTRLNYANVAIAVGRVKPVDVASYLAALMLRNIATERYIFTDPRDPLNPDAFSRPGCVIASPSFETGTGQVGQDYVFHWTRDAAITAIELAAADRIDPQTLRDYVDFSRTCQKAPGAAINRAAYTIAGRPRENWTDQSDGPALRILAALRSYPALDDQGQAVARDVIAADADFLMGAYRQETFNLWEEAYGFSFFARAVQLRCLRELAGNPFGIESPQGASSAIRELEQALSGHWDQDAGIYRTFGPGSSFALRRDDRQGPVPSYDRQGSPAGYDPNIDIVMAAIYGGVSITDPKLLATAAAIRRQWTDPGASTVYPINQSDSAQGLGPLLGRYPGDTYDGDIGGAELTIGHPWALCTANYAELYYRLATEVATTQAVPQDPMTGDFFAQVGIAPQTSPVDAAAALQAAGDRMLAALLFHSDDLELSEQFDKTTGFEKSVRNLTWSYAAYLSAVRAATVNA